MDAPEILRGLVRGLHHVAIAVPSIEAARPLYEGALGMVAGEVEFVPGQKVNVLVLMAGAQRVELVEPASEDSPISGYLEKRGGGIHHLCAGREPGEIEDRAEGQPQCGQHTGRRYGERLWYHQGRMQQRKGCGEKCDASSSSANIEPCTFKLMLRGARLPDFHSHI